MLWTRASKRLSSLLPLAKRNLSLKQNVYNRIPHENEHIRSISSQSYVEGFNGHPKERRVVITGIGLVTPYGIDVNEFWSRLIKGESVIRNIESEEILSYGMAAKTAAYIKDEEFDPKPWIPHQISSVCARFEAFGIAASTLALNDAKWHPNTEEDRIRTGVSIGTGIGSLEDTAQADEALRTKGARRVSPYALPRLLANLAAGQISIMHGLKGPNHCASTACTTGAHSIGDAFRFIKFGDADVMLAGGTEATVTPLGIALFNRIHALSRKSFPDLPSSPFDYSRDGFVMGEGAGVLVLEEAEHALRRGAKVYAEVIGYGLSADAHHVTQPPETGEGAARAMRAALQHAGITNWSEVEYINAHATGTPLGDRAEICAIADVFSESNHPKSSTSMTYPIVTSTKGALGHMLGGAGAVEAAVCALAIDRQEIPPTVGVRQLDPGLTPGPRLLYREHSDHPALISIAADDDGQGVGGESIESQASSASSPPSTTSQPPWKVELYDPKKHLPKNGIRTVLSNSFAFGGSNASLVFRRWQE